MLKYALAAAAATSVLATAAAAQDYNLPAGYGSTALTAGFMPDPFAVQLQAGGSIDAVSSVGNGCLGMIANAPDYELTYTSNGGPLYVSVESGSDTTLVINGPDGSWHCNDDSRGLNPGVTFPSAPSGVYDIWVGTYYSAGGYPDATLYISELGEGASAGGYGAPTTPGIPALPGVPATPSAPAAPGVPAVPGIPAAPGVPGVPGVPTAGPDWSLPPSYGEINLTTGFLPDPHTVNLQAGGEIDARMANLGPGCLGGIATAPDYSVNYTAGSTYPLIFNVLSGSDTTLVVNAPDTSWHCNDDYNGLNPSVRFDNPQSGRYDIWVGTYGGTGAYPQATLYVTEIPN